jgi:hypothetical protein
MLERKINPSRIPFWVKALGRLCWLNVWRNHVVLALVENFIDYSHA